MSKVDSVVECKINCKKIAKFIQEQMSDEFDSHEFIKMFIKKYPDSYGLLLIAYKNVTTTHSQIANFLRNNAEELHIEENPNKKKSNSIFEKTVPNASWRKINKL